MRKKLKQNSEFNSYVLEDFGYRKKNSQHMHYFEALHKS